MMWLKYFSWHQSILISTLLLVNLLFALQTTADTSTTFTVDYLFKQLKRSAPVRLSFSETKKLAFFDVDLKQEGFIEILPPDTIRREIIKPESQITLIEGNLVTITSVSKKSGHKIRTLNINEHPAIGAFVSAFRAPITGDLELLQESFSIQLEGTFEHWSVTLNPTHYSVSSYLAEIILTGEEDQLMTIETIETNKDASFLILSPIE